MEFERFIKNCGTSISKCVKEQKEPQLQRTSPLHCLCSERGYDSPGTTGFPECGCGQSLQAGTFADCRCDRIATGNVWAIVLFDLLTLTGKPVDTQNRPVALCFTSASCWLTNYFKPALRLIPYNCTDKHIAKNANRKYSHIPSQQKTLKVDKQWRHLGLICTPQKT